MGAMKRLDGSVVHLQAGATAALCVTLALLSSEVGPLWLTIGLLIVGVGVTSGTLMSLAYPFVPYGWAGIRQFVAVFVGSLVCAVTVVILAFTAPDYLPVLLLALTLALVWIFISKRIRNPNLLECCTGGDVSDTDRLQRDLYERYHKIVVVEVCALATLALASSFHVAGVVILSGLAGFVVSCSLHTGWLGKTYDLLGLGIPILLLIGSFAGGWVTGTWWWGLICTLALFVAIIATEWVLSYGEYMEGE